MISGRTLFLAVTLVATVSLTVGGQGRGAADRIQKRSYLFKETNETLEYDVFVSSRVDPKKKSPLVIALHGAGVPPAVVLRSLMNLAEKNGYIMAAPMGYNLRGFYGAAGPGNTERSNALALGSDWLATQLPLHTGASLVTALAALVEVAAVNGAHADQVAQHGDRLVQEVLSADEQNWARQRPELLSPHVPAATIADGGRLLRLLPGFGVEVGRCALVRQLMLGQLRERADRKQDGPEVVAAMVFGSADLQPFV